MGESFMVTDALEPFIINLPEGGWEEGPKVVAFSSPLPLFSERLCVLQVYTFIT